MKYENISKHEALVKAQTMINATSETLQLSRVTILTKYYQGSLHAMQRSKKGQEYTSSRGLDYEKHSIGYCGYEVGKSWNKNLQESVDKMGLYQIKNCLIFPNPALYFSLALSVEEDLVTSHIAIIILTGRSNRDSRLDCVDLGADAYLTKPFDIGHLESKIKSVLKNRKLLRSYSSSTNLMQVTQNSDFSKDDLRFM